MPRTPASNFYSLLFKRKKKKKTFNLWRGENPKDVNDCNFQVKSLNLVLCAMLILSCFVLEKPLSGWKPVVFRIVLGEGGGDFLNPGDTKSDLHVWRPSEYLL